MKKTITILVLVLIAMLISFMVSVNMPRPTMVVPPPIAAVEGDLPLDVFFDSVEVTKTVPKTKKKSAKCAPAETEAYDWAFFNAYRANALSGKKQWVQGPNPCKK